MKSFLRRLFGKADDPVFSRDGNIGPVSGHGNGAFYGHEFIPLGKGESIAFVPPKSRIHPCYLPAQWHWAAMNPRQTTHVSEEPLEGEYIPESYFLDYDAASCLEKEGRIFFCGVSIYYPSRDYKVVTEVKKENGNNKVSSYIVLHVFPDGGRVLLPYFFFNKSVISEEVAGQ